MSSNISAEEREGEGGSERVKVNDCRYCLWDAYRDFLFNWRVWNIHKPEIPARCHRINGRISQSQLPKTWMFDPFLINGDFEYGCLHLVWWNSCKFPYEILFIQINDLLKSIFDAAICTQALHSDDGIDQFKPAIFGILNWPIFDR